MAVSSSSELKATTQFPSPEAVPQLVGKSNFHIWHTSIARVLFDNPLSAALILDDWPEPRPSPTLLHPSDSTKSPRSEWHYANTQTCRFIRSTLAMNVIPFVRQHSTGKALWHHLQWLYGEARGIDLQGGPAMPGSQTDLAARKSLLETLKVQKERDGTIRADVRNPELTKKSSDVMMNGSAPLTVEAEGSKGKDKQHSPSAVKLTSHIYTLKSPQKSSVLLARSSSPPSSIRATPLPELGIQKSTLVMPERSYPGSTPKRHEKHISTVLGRSSFARMASTPNLPAIAEQDGPHPGSRVKSGYFPGYAASTTTSTPGSGEGSSVNSDSEEEIAAPEAAQSSTKGILKGILKKPGVQIAHRSKDRKRDKVMASFPLRTLNRKQDLGSEIRY